MKVTLRSSMNARAVEVRAHEDGHPPVPDWKRSDWACDVLPENDPARQPGPSE